MWKYWQPYLGQHPRVADMRHIQKVSSRLNKQDFDALTGMWQPGNISKIFNIHCPKDSGHIDQCILNI